MKRWMTSLAPNRRTKFVSFTSRLLGKCSSGTRLSLGRAGLCGISRKCPLHSSPKGHASRAHRSRGPAGLGDAHFSYKLSAQWRTSVC